jgi:hypothetical protein
VSEDPQKTLTGFSRGELEEIIRKVLREEGRPKRDAWDTTYKGDPFWLEFRAHSLQRIRANVAITRRDIDQDAWFAKNGNITTDVQWIRAVDQHLVPNKPPGPDGLELRVFSLGPRRGRYLTQKSWLHCAIAIVAERHGVRDRTLVQSLRVKYDCTAPCELCPKTADTQRELLEALADAARKEES